MRRASRLDVAFWSLCTAGSAVLTGFAGYELICVAKQDQMRTISSRANRRIVEHRAASFITTMVLSYVAGMLANHFWETRSNDGNIHALRLRGNASSKETPL